MSFFSKEREARLGDGNMDDTKFRAILEHVGHIFTFQQDNDPKHTVRASMKISRLDKVVNSTVLRICGRTWKVLFTNADYPIWLNLSYFAKNRQKLQLLSVKHTPKDCNCIQKCYCVLCIFTHHHFLFTIICYFKLVYHKKSPLKYITFCGCNVTKCMSTVCYGWVLGQMVYVK